MACLRVGSKPDIFQRQGETWMCSPGLSSDITIEVQRTFFRLHKFPLVSRSEKLAQLLEGREREMLHIDLSDIPGGSDAFELAARFCYGLWMEINASNVVPLTCAAEYLAMTEHLGESNLIAKTDGFLHQVILSNWQGSIQALISCDTVFPHAEKLGLVNMCVEAVATKACMNPDMSTFQNAMYSPGGSLLWNGISTGAKPKNIRSDWWHDDVTPLSLHLFKRVIMAMATHGLSSESIAGAVVQYAKKYLSDPTSNIPMDAVNDQKLVLETVESLLPLQKGVVATRFLSGLLRSAIILNPDQACRDGLERRIGMQLEQATPEDILMPNRASSHETVYDTDCAQRILDHFLSYEQVTGVAFSSPNAVDDVALTGSPTHSPILTVARLMDVYLAEIASDGNLKPGKFISLACSLPNFSRTCDDGLYRAIDIYLKAHAWVKDEEREQLCRTMDCQKLSLDACTHAAQNERLPLRVVVQVLFFEQLQLRTAIASCFLMSDSSCPLLCTQPCTTGSMQSEPTRGAAQCGADSMHVGPTQVLKVDMENMRHRVTDLEKECSGMRREIDKLTKLRPNWWVLFSKTVGGRLTHGCKVKGSAVRDQAQPDESAKTSSQKCGHERKLSCA